MSRPFPYAVLFRGRWACPCLAAWLPVYEAELVRRGVVRQSVDIYQLIGGADESANTHLRGGAYDIVQRSPVAILVAREMGAAAFARDTMSPPHQHGVLNGCPHNGLAAYQVDALEDGYDGLGKGGRGGRDTGPREPVPLRTWREGIAWAREQAKPYRGELVEHAIRDLERSKGAGRRGQLIKGALRKLRRIEDVR